MKKAYLLIVFCFTLGLALITSGVSLSAKDVSFSTIDQNGGTGTNTSRSLIKTDVIESEIVPTKQNSKVGYSIAIVYDLYKYSLLEYGVPFTALTYHEFGASSDTVTYTITNSNSVNYTTTEALSLSIGASISLKLTASASLFDLIKVGSEKQTTLSTEVTTSISNSISKTTYHEESTSIDAYAINGPIVLFVSTWVEAYKYETLLTYKIYKWTRENDKSKTDFENKQLVSTIRDTSIYFYAKAKNNTVIGTGAKYFPTFPALEAWLQKYYV
ncbi:MAG: hypothetical protein LBV55_03310 [Acholeplasmatales bacterium]|jgi:hypothetical protein|nr:hypothetical protein [Acholeplasmatales bacterium]